MIMEDLISRSPLRILENSIHGGLGKGNIGTLASLKGVGKTACLVHIATDKLFQRKPVIHVSYASRVDHIISWYEDVFRQLAGGADPGAAAEIHDELVKIRVIMNFSQAGMRTEQVLKSLEALIQDGLKSLRSGRTTFVIAHRLSTIMSADQILVVEEGAALRRTGHAPRARLLPRSYRRADHAP